MIERFLRWFWRWKEEDSERSRYRRFVSRIPSHRATMYLFAALVWMLSLVFCTADIQSWILFPLAGETTQGVVTKVTRHSGGRYGGDSYETEYRFEVDGSVHNGKSYGRVGSKGSRVDVEYLPDYPDVSQVAGLRRGRISAFVGLLIVGLTTLVGLGFRWLSHREYRSLWLCFTKGSVIKGRVIHAAKPRSGWNRSENHRAVVEFRLSGNRVLTQEAYLNSAVKIGKKVPVYVYESATAVHHALAFELPDGVELDYKHGVRFTENERLFSRRYFAYVLIPFGVVFFLVVLILSNLPWFLVF